MNLIFMILILAMNSSFAEEFTSQFHSVAYSKDIHSPHIIRWQDGRVSYLDNKQAQLAEVLENEAFNSVLSITNDHKSNLVALATARVVEERLGQLQTENEEYVPSVLKTEEEVTKMLKRTRRSNPFQFNIQCYNLAHVRSYEEFERTGNKTMKIFLFFTEKYLREYRFKWWFHVTPMTYIEIEGKPEGRVLDREWSRGPLTLIKWTDKFVKSKKECPQITKYSEFSSGQEEAHCYLFPVSMYYWVPKDLEKLENEGVTKNAFDMDEIHTAYRMDF